MKSVLVALGGGVVGFFAVTIADGVLTGSNMAGILGILIGIPIGMMTALTIYGFVRKGEK
jgi:hypothetical protein